MGISGAAVWDLGLVEASGSEVVRPGSGIWDLCLVLGSEFFVGDLWWVEGCGFVLWDQELVEDSGFGV